MEEFLSSSAVPTPSSGSRIHQTSNNREEADDDGLLDLETSNAFDDEDDDDDDDSIGWAYTLDDFEFVRKLGSGGSANVYEVVEPATRAVYALKVQLATEDALCELDLHIPMKHANICQMFDYFYSDVKPFVEHDVGHAIEIDIDRGEEEQTNTNTTYLCTMLEACDHGDLHDLIDEHVAVPEPIAAKVNKSKKKIVESVVRACAFLDSEFASKLVSGGVNN